MNRRLTAVLAALGALAIIVVGVSLESDDDGDDRGGDQPAASEDTPSEETPASQTPTESESATPEPTEPTSEETEDAQPMSFVGHVRGGAATLAVVVDGSEATAYFCDGADLESWLGGRSFAGRLELSGDNGSLDADVDENRTSGSVRVEGQRFGFTLRQVDPPEGLYRFADTVDGAEVKGGWIVLPSGRQVGLLTVDGETQPAPMLDTDTGEVEVDGEVLTVEQLS
jgi:hypothetical protein